MSPASTSRPGEGELLRMELEWAVYERVVARFNAAANDRSGFDGVTPGDFYAWLLEAYAGLEPIRERLGQPGLAAAVRDVPAAARGERTGPAGRFLDDVAAELARATPLSIA